MEYFDQAVDTITPYINKWTLSLLGGTFYFLMNRDEWLGDSSDPNIEPLQLLVVIVIIFLSCWLCEWAFRRQGFLAHLTVIPAASPMLQQANTGTIMQPTAWNED